MTFVIATFSKAVLYTMKYCIAAFRITTLSTTTFSLKAFSITTLGMLTFSITVERQNVNLTKGQPGIRSTRHKET